MISLLIAWLLNVACGPFLYLLYVRLIPSRNNWLCKLMLFGAFLGSSGMPIWVGDNNLAFVFPIFTLCCMLGTRGSWIGRLAVTLTFFCLEMSVCAILDNYLFFLTHTYDWTTRILRPILFGMLYLSLRRVLPQDGLHLPERLWKIMLGLSSMPVCALLSIVLITYHPQYDSVLLERIAQNLGFAVLPFVLLSAVVILLTAVVLADHEQLERGKQLSEMREAYYQNLNRQEKQIRHLRHDLRNHLITVQGMIAREHTEQAAEYLADLLDSPALKGGKRICQNETANAVLVAKEEAMQQSGLQADFRVALPEDLGISPLDLCALLGNALDNAIEAAQEAKNRQIAVRCRCDKDMFMLKVVNGFSGDRQDTLMTTKPDKEQHGFGLAGMREIAQRYNGTLETVISNQTFELTVCMLL